MGGRQRSIICDVASGGGPLWAGARARVACAHAWRPVKAERTLLRPKLHSQSVALTPILALRYFRSRCCLLPGSSTLNLHTPQTQGIVWGAIIAPTCSNGIRQQQGMAPASGRGRHSRPRPSSILLAAGRMRAVSWCLQLPMRRDPSQGAGLHAITSSGFRASRHQ